MGLLAVVATFLMMMLLFIAAHPAHAVSTFTVNRTDDLADANLNDARCDVNLNVSGDSCTLRASIEQANFNPNAGGPDEIDFNIVTVGGPPVKTISPTSELPSITQPVIIDGYSQPGATVNTASKGTNAVLLIELNGTNAGGAGLEIDASNTTVRGLVINRFAAGVNLADTPTTTGNKLEGCFLGTDPTGTQQGFGNFTDGVFVLGTNTTVGGTTKEARNLISGNGDHGVPLSPAATNDKVQGNLIGTKADGKGDLGNDSFGVVSQGADHAIGGDSGSAANTIAFNGSDGVNIASAAGTGNRILRNSIFSNAGLGIDLVGGSENASGATANDGGTADDSDTGPNGLQNTPELTSVTTNATTTITIEGRLDTTPSKEFTLQFFSQSGGNEGKKFIKSEQISTDSDGRVPFSFQFTKKVGVGQKKTATATGAEGTSEFSAPEEALAAAP